MESQDKTIWKKVQTKVIDIVMGGLFAGMIVLVGFYYTAKAEIQNLTQKSDNHEQRITQNEKDISNAKIAPAVTQEWMKNVDERLDRMEKQFSIDRQEQKQDLNRMYDVLLELKKK